MEGVEREGLFASSPSLEPGTPSPTPVPVTAPQKKEKRKQKQEVRPALPKVRRQPRRPTATAVGPVRSILKCRETGAAEKSAREKRATEKVVLERAEKEKR